MLLSLTAAAAVSLIVTLRRQRIKVMALVNHCRLTPIVQAGWVRAVSSHTLVPGDVVVLQRGKAMCDMVLLQGACLVVESMLSGEVSYLLLFFFFTLVLPPLLPHPSPRPLLPHPSPSSSSSSSPLSSSSSSSPLSFFSCSFLPCCPSLFLISLVCQSCFPFLVFSLLLKPIVHLESALAKI